MDFIVLTTVTGILKPVAWFFGIIFNWLYELLSFAGIENIAVTLVLFTIIVKMLMLPLTIKQQRFSKLSALMQPELQAITEKYKGKKDENSMRLQQMEQSEVYAKYGSNPASGCLPILITFPIMIGMYKIIYAIPAYVSKIGNLYKSIATQISYQTGYADFLVKVASEDSLRVTTKNFTEVSSGVMSEEHIIDILTNFGTEQWTKLFYQYPALNNADINGTIDKINSIFSVFGLNILNSPKYYAGLNGFFNIALLVPVLAVLTQLLSSLLSKAQNKTSNSKNNDNPMAQSMNSMLYVMPFMSGIFCYGFSLVIGIYWIIQTVVSVIQQIVINRYIEKSDMSAYIAKNVEKQKKKMEKFGVNSSSNYMAELAKRQTKSIDPSYKAQETKSTSSYATMGASSKKSDKNENTDESSNGEGTDVKAVAPEKKSVSAYANLLKRD